MSKITLSTGRVFDANCGIVGISPELEVSEGYDSGSLDTTLLDTFEVVPWPPCDRIALADLMLARWLTYKERALDDAWKMRGAKSDE